MTPKVGLLEKINQIDKCLERLMGKLRDKAQITSVRNERELFYLIRMREYYELFMPISSTM